MKMELIEGSETSAIRTQTPGNYPKENMLHIEHGGSLKSTKIVGTYVTAVQVRIQMCSEGEISSR